MRRGQRFRWVGLTAIVLVAVSAIEARSDNDVVSVRVAMMKALEKDVSAITAFCDDKGDLSAARAAGEDIAIKASKTAELFPKGTDMADLPGASYARQTIWTNRVGFIAQAKLFAAEAEVLNTALKGNDKNSIAAYLADMTKNGCDACHQMFRERKPS